MRLLVIREVDNETLLPLVGGGVEVGVEVHGGGHDHLAGAHGAHHGLGQGAGIVSVPEKVKLDQLLANSLKKYLSIGSSSEAVIQVTPYLPVIVPSFYGKVHFDTASL